MIENYINAHLDRRMKDLIEEWQLTTRADVADFSQRLQSLEKELASLTEFEDYASRKLTELETRLKKVKEGHI